MSTLTKPALSQKSDIFLRNFIQKAASIGTWEFDVINNSLYWSDETKNIHDVSLSYVPDLQSGILFYKEGYSRNTITELFSTCMESFEKFDVELQIVTSKGQEKWVRAIGIPVVENGTCTKVQGIFQDINEKTKNSKSLALKQQQLRRTFDNALIGMAILDLKGKWIDVNQSLCNTFGYTKNELMALSLQKVTHPNDHQKGYDSMIDMLNGKINSFKTEKRYIHKNGKTVWTLLSISIVHDEVGKPMHFVAQVNDLTQLKKSASKVEHLITTTENQNKRLLNFAHIVSHNLRSHFSNLDMLLDIMKIDELEATKNSIFPLFEDAVKNLGETVSNLNDVAAINTGKGKNTEKINLFESIEKALSTLTANVIKTKSKVNIKVSPEIYVMGIPAYIDSILLNFLTNAIKYRKKDKNVEIRLEACVKDDFVILEINDNGQGIDLCKHGKKLFGMYKTFHKHEDARGLGLFITKNQVEAIGGKIEVNSEVNRGTSFFIHLKKYEAN